CGAGSLLDLGGRTHEYRLDESCLGCFNCASQSRLFARVCHCSRNCFETLASLQQLFILSGSCFRAHLSLRWLCLSNQNLTWTQSVPSAVADGYIVDTPQNQDGYTPIRYRGRY